MSSLAEPLDLARRCHRAGDLSQAERLARQAVQSDADNGPAWHLLGDVLLSQNRSPDAADAYRQALRLQPGAPDLHYGLGLALARQGRPAEAVPHFRQALHRRPEHAPARRHLGIALAELGRLDEALPLLRQAAQESPNSAPVHLNLGTALAQAGRPEEAAASLEQALRLQPDYPAACYNLGNVLRELRRHEEAIERYRQALRLRPDYAEAFNNLGLALTEARRPEEAVVFLRQAVRLRPAMKEAHNNLALAYADLGRFAEAEACCQEALRLDAGYVEAHSNLGNVYKEQGRLAEALACYQLALWLNPEAASTHYNRALAWLQRGDYARGWPAYEWRWRRPQTPPRPFPQPRWDGSPLRGKTVLLYMEQGLGDMVHFLRYAPLVRRQGGRVVVECPASLVPLFSTCPGIDQLVAEGEPLPAFDVQAPLLSLPGLLGTTLATVPAGVPYLHAEPERVARWRQRLGAASEFRVGVVWQGNPRHAWDRHRSTPLACFAPLAEVAGVGLYSLQKGPGVEQLRAAAGRPAVVDLGEELDAAGGAFRDTAAVMQCLDLVVTADTAAAHLAGALGVPVWVALSAIADWRWLVGREDTPWYPTMRLFRQERLGDWDEVFARMAGALRRLLEERR
ncbi:MAG TPA: tetratricopeptide repeat protein, partial [Gemmataceae bacterium]|nr:tetratricopeptide repeat protein [Gemmataceae bacterium]